MGRLQQAPEGAPSLFVFPSSEQTTSSMERALLGALMLEPAAILTVAELDADDLFHMHHRALLLLLRRLHVAKKTWDPTLILSMLESDPVELEACGGSLAAISGYPDDCPSIEILPYYVEAIQDAAARKRLRKVASQVAEEITNATMDRREDLAAVVERAKRALHGALPAFLPVSADGPDDTVWRQLSLNAQRLPRPTLSNIYTILRDDPRWQDLRLNLLGSNIERGGEAKPHEAQFIADAARWMATHYELEVGAQVLQQALLAAAQGRAYHPVAAYLEALTWDGVERIKDIRTAILGCPETLEHEAHPRLHAAYLERFLIGSVARALKPGCKMDTALILVGAQGSFKSSFFRELYGAPFFGDSPIPIGDKDAFIQLKSVWCYEAAEMEDLGRKTAEAVKQFLSASSDVYRAPYDREARHHPRHSVMVGSSNRKEILTDETGSRRFWPITIPREARINLPLLREQRDQLWAEAVALYRSGAPWWFSREEEDALGRAEDIEQYEEEDPWTPPIRAYLLTRLGAPSHRMEEFFDVLKLDQRDRHKANQRKIGGILTRLGFENTRDRLPNGERPRVWVRKEDVKPTPDPDLPF